MYVAKNRDEVIGTGKTLMEAYTDLLDCDSCYTDPDTVKFYKCQEIKVELKEVTVTTTKVVAAKKPTTTRK